MGSLIVIVILIALAWLLLALPARRRQRAHRAMQDGVEVGDEIITAGGIHARVRHMSAEELEVEIAPDVVVRLDRRAVAAVAVEEELEPDEALEPGEEPASTEVELGDAGLARSEGDADPR